MLSSLLSYLALLGLDELSEDVRGDGVESKSADIGKAVSPQGFGNALRVKLAAEDLVGYTVGKEGCGFMGESWYMRGISC